jgi:ABC-type Fe3+/spermidine/putrescine transport system ATPase subunit
MKNIYGVYFICCINNYLEVVQEQIEILNKGLFQKTKKLIIFITQYKDEDILMINNILNILNYNKIIIIKTSENLYEKFAINNYKKYIKDKNYLLYYFHTKGLKQKNDPLINIFSSRRKILNFYTLEKYEINIKLLETYDAVGCALHLYPKKHFSGNFWWSKHNYLKKLYTINDKYLSPEMYILSNKDCKYISLANDINDILFENYLFRNDDEIINKTTNNFIVIEDHKKLLYLCD